LAHRSDAKAAQRVGKSHAVFLLDICAFDEPICHHLQKADPPLERLVREAVSFCSLYGALFDKSAIPMISLLPGAR